MNNPRGAKTREEAQRPSVDFSRTALTQRARNPPALSPLPPSLRSVVLNQRGFVARLLKAPILARLDSEVEQVAVARLFVPSIDVGKREASLFATKVTPAREPILAGSKRPPRSPKGLRTTVLDPATPPSSSSFFFSSSSSPALRFCFPRSSSFSPALLPHHRTTLEQVGGRHCLKSSIEFSTPAAPS